ncbi:ABC transporter permease [Phytohabitans sp. ZYX-F-186]|uniref:ABC transporter permease n=1 Tax=Phytohabitans maris TaxID=3071409 RepID=A0ABU0ZVT8_9ACTN|nr:ABC transporter permease [Phytohabitans sp. ZYX-F-186]MDQ7911063.1 ABC transporter permease [Phytohabitans sp. ZYX-F-186]
MAVSGQPPVALFVRLKLRVMANNMRGKGWRIALFLVGLAFGLWWSVAGLLLLAAPGFTDDLDAAVLASALGGAVLVVGWVLMPLILFGVDETLDPARFALLPLRRRTLVTGLLAAAMVGIPALAALVATSGLVIAAALLGGWGAAVTQAAGTIAGLVLCVAASRAVTSAFATMLRSRKVRDLAVILLACLAALLGPVQIGVTALLSKADWDRLLGPAHVIGWTPLAAPYTMGVDVAQGRAWTVPLKLLITAATVAALLWWWSRTMESAMLGAESAGPAKAAPTGASAVAQLFPRRMPWLPRNRYGALVAREARYWWRDARRRAGLVTFAVVGVVMPVMINIGSGGLSGAASPVVVSLTMVFVGVLGAATLANQFGYDGSAYAANVVAGVPGAVELRARLAAFSTYLGPLLLGIAAMVAAFLREPAWIGVMLGSLGAAYGSGLAVNLFVSLHGAYALPETSNPFAVNTGSGVAKSLLGMLGLIGAAAVAIPIVVVTALAGDAPVWLWLAAPAGVAYGAGAAWLGTYLVGDMLDRQMPELLQAVTPNR